MEKNKGDAKALPSISITYLSDKEFIERFYPDRPYRGMLIGGLVFLNSKEIYIKESRKHDKKLLKHELGHLKGYKHTYFPSIMNKSWFFRWINSYYPPYK